MLLQESEYKLSNCYFPLFVDIREKQILVIGAGNIALRRIEALSSFGAFIRVITRDIPLETREKITDMANKGLLKLQQRNIVQEDITEDLAFVLACTDSKSLNASIYQWCKEKGIVVNVCSDASLCDFYFPAIAVKEDIVIGISGCGDNHRKVANMASKIRTYLEKQDEDD
ncbi:precorrin-2 dehydrogenase/sirohydrochlorin ferrochelatase family protein [Lachnospiraceae bacterium LCP25S3_G4]